MLYLHVLFNTKYKTKLKNYTDIIIQKYKTKIYKVVESRTDTFKALYLYERSHEVYTLKFLRNEDCRVSDSTLISIVDNKKSQKYSVRVILIIVSFNK